MALPKTEIFIVKNYDLYKNAHRQKYYRDESIKYLSQSAWGYEDLNLILESICKDGPPKPKEFNKDDWL